MEVPRRFPWLKFSLIFLGTAALSGLLWKLAAYDSYSDISQPDSLGNCASCHELAVGGFQSKGRLHDAHTNNATSTCLLCHTSTGDVPRLNSSGATGGKGCIGCHGQPLSTGAVSGAGLRRHHALAGAPADPLGRKCVTCHTSDPTPPPENTVPVYYTRTDVTQKSPCNTDGKEDFWSRLTGAPDGRGLDNDGNLLYDAISDPACGACPDRDQDGYGDPGSASCRNGPARDCDDTNANIHPGAVEAYNQLDDNCNGEIDEIENVAIKDPLNRQRLSWSPQPPTGQLYDVIRSDGAQFPSTSPNSACLVVGTSMTSLDDTASLPLKTTFYYLVRNTLVLDYGRDSRGALRLYTLCP